ncbi:MAG: heme exporter protein CcmB [Pseudomonadales bacterium]|nr:heme exporter protein CcmB [Pseudomonadales bacterium]
MNDIDSEVLPLSQGFWALLKRDLVLAFRQRGDMINPLFFFVMVISLFPLGVGPEASQLQKMAPGIIWIAALLSTLLAVDSLFRQDFDDGALELLLLSPHPLFVLVSAKVFAHWLVTSVPLIIASPFLGVMLFLEGEVLGVVMLTLLIGTPILSMISAIGAALTVGLRKGGVLIAIIALPLYVPVLIFGTSAIQAASIELPYIGQLAYLAALLAIAVTFAPFAIAAGLRVSVSG